MEKTNRVPINEKYGNVKRSILRNLLFSMLAFGLAIGIIFPFFAWFVLKTDAALSLFFFVMCIIAGLVVGSFNFYIFRVIVSRELDRIQKGMHHINKNISTINILEEGCENDCLLDITSADIIGDITLAFNDMTKEVFNRLFQEIKTKVLVEDLSKSVDLVKSVELEDVASTILHKTAGMMDAKCGLIYGGTVEKMNLLADFGVDRSDKLLSTIKEDLGPVNHAFSSGAIQIFAKDEGWDWLNQTTPFGKVKPSAILLIPLLANQRPVGMVVLATGSQKLDENQMQRLETLRNFAAPHLDNAILHRRITEIAALDDLTRLLNRRFGMRRLQEEFSRATRHGIPMSVIMIDIDHFKNLNDTFGHDAGDTVLKVVASILSSNIRAEDMACRYGGEEFLVLLSGAGMNDSAIIADRFRRMIEAESVNWGTSNLSISISAGMATYPIVRSSVPEELITFADKALYKAKDAGRNQVMVNDGVRIIPFAELEIAKQTRKSKRNQKNN